MEGDPNRKQRFCSLNFSVCKKDAALQKQGCISILNKEACLNQNAGEGMALASVPQSSVNDVVAMDIVKRREASSCVPSSKEQQAPWIAPKRLEMSACKEPLRVVEAVTQEAQSSKLVTRGKEHYGEKASPDVTCVRQSKKGATQSGIMDFLTAPYKKQDLKQDKAPNGSLKSTKMQPKWEAELHTSTRIKIPLNEKKEGNSLASTLNLPSTNFELKGYALEKEDDQKLSLSNPKGFNYNQKSDIIESDFFLPASKKCRLQRRQEAANISISDCPRASKKDSLGLRCRPNDVKIAEATSRSGLTISKQPASNEDFFRPASKKKKMMNKEVTLKLGSITKAEIRDEKKFEFDLQMEAKLAAEENAQLSAGKPSHPFFSQHKVGPQASSICCSFWDASFTPAASILEVEDLNPAPPFHINQLDKAKECEAGSQTTSFAPSCLEREKNKPVFKPRFSAKSMEELGTLLKRPFLGKSCMTTRLKVCLVDHAKDSSGASLDLTSSCTAAGRTSRNLLWADVYQPQSPEQVCDNKESVKSMSEWLQSWQIRCTSLLGRSGEMFHRTIANGEDCDEDKGWSEEDSDGGENTSNDYVPPNVLVLVGPVGCGKTAAIYACAKAHGYTVIEVNCSDNRTGTLIKQKFSEAMESHRVCKWSADATFFPLTKRNYYAESNVCRGTTYAVEAKKAEQVDGKKNSGNVAANIDSKHIRKSEPLSRCAHMASEAQQLGESDDPIDNKEMTILLFEDVDLVFEDDRGFMAAVAQVATSAKRPIILTSNDKALCLPHNLCSHLLELNRPSSKDLVSLAYRVCIAEGVECSPELLQKVVNVCNHDARKMLNYLQFWCQGQLNAKAQHTELIKEVAKVGNDETLLQENDSSAIINLFVLEAQHRLWPSYIDLDVPCEVTEAVACKLSETVSETETKQRADKEKKLVQEVVKKRVLLDKMKRRMIDSPPDVGFNHPYDREGDGITDEASAAEERSLSTTPNVGFNYPYDWEGDDLTDFEEARTTVQSPLLERKIRRQLVIVMSDSDDDKPGATHEEQFHQDEHQSHVKPKPLRCLTSLRTSREMGSINGEETPASSSLHAEASTMYAGTSKSDATHSEKSQSTSNCSLEELESNQAAPCSFPTTLEPVYNLWSYFRSCSKNKEEFLLSAASKESFSIVSSLSDLVDNLSACDIMSCMRSCKQDVKEETLIFSTDENLECCNRSPVCAQIAHESFQVCLRDLRAVAGFMHEDTNAVSIEDMMLAVDDPFTLGKLVSDEKLNHQGRTFCGQASPLCEEQDLKRLQKKSSLQINLFTDLPPTAQRSFHGAAFYECLSLLAWMGRLEQDRLALGLTRQRAKGCQSLFCGHPWNLSEDSITLLQSFGNFGRP